MTTAVFWMGNIIVAQVTPIMLASPLQTFGTFYVLVGVHIAALLFVLLTLPETKVQLYSLYCYILCIMTRSLIFLCIGGEFGTN